MKNKIGFNLVFALLAFLIGIALFREFDFETFTFKKTALGILYLITFIFCIIFMLKKKLQHEK
jgi:tryptophan-rich sensory protein